MSAWEFLNTDFGVLLAAFVLTTIVGTILTGKMQRDAWARETRVELMRERYAEGTRLLESLSTLLGRRFFASKRYFWAIEKPDKYDLNAVAGEYFAVVAEWNSKIWDIRNKIRLLLSESHANRFLDYRDDFRGEMVSIHYKFVRLGLMLQDARDNAMDMKLLQREVDRVNHSCSNLLESLTTDFVVRASALELLNVTDAQLPTMRQANDPTHT